MADAIEKAAGSFGWYELMTTDTAAAGAFYGDVVGWTTRSVGSAEMPYSAFEVNGAGVAGMMPLPPEAGSRPAWVGYIHVADLESFVEQVVAAGGTLHKGPVDVPGMLRFAVMMDPQGAPFVLFTPAPMMGDVPKGPEPGSPGTIGWHELMAGDGATAFEFYTKTFGWTAGAEHDMGPMGLYRVFAVEGKDAGGIMTKPPEMPAPFWNYYFNVDGIRAAVERITAGGGTVMMGPHQVPGGGWIVVGMDPQGAAFCLLSMTE